MTHLLRRMLSFFSVLFMTVCSFAQGPSLLRELGKDDYSKSFMPLEVCKFKDVIYLRSSDLLRMDRFGDITAIRSQFYGNTYPFNLVPT